MNKNTFRRLRQLRVSLRQNSKSGSISTSVEKNLDMVVFHNTNAQGVKSSITRFVPLNPLKSVYKRSYATR